MYRVPNLFDVETESILFPEGPGKENSEGEEKQRQDEGERSVASTSQSFRTTSHTLSDVQSRP